MNTSFFSTVPLIFEKPPERSMHILFYSEKKPELMVELEKYFGKSTTTQFDNITPDIFIFYDYIKALFELMKVSPLNLLEGNLEEAQNNALIECSKLENSLQQPSQKIFEIDTYPIKHATSLLYQISREKIHDMKLVTDNLNNKISDMQKLLQDNIADNNVQKKARRKFAIRL